MAVRTAPHGSLGRIQAGCACGVCQRAQSQRYYGTPRAKKPPVTRRLGKAVVEMNPTADLRELSLESDWVVDRYGNRTVRVKGECHPETWDELTSSDSMITKAQDAVQEVTNTVPSTKKIEVDPTKYRKGGRGKESVNVEPGAGGVQPLEIAVLIAQARVLAEGLVTGETNVAVAMKQYGRLRDEIARRRREFAEAEGAFEFLQAAIQQKVVGDL